MGSWGRSPRNSTLYLWLAGGSGGLPEGRRLCWPLSRTKGEKPCDPPPARRPQHVKPQLNVKVIRGLYEIDRLLARAFVVLPSREKADDVAVARTWIRRMNDWWDEREEPEDG